MPRVLSRMVAVIIAATLAFTPAAHATTSPAFDATATRVSDAVRFWGYWQARGASWAFAPVGPAQAKPEDGTVEGWRFAVSEGNSGTPPRAEPEFAKICSSSKAGAGNKRVAVVLDFGEANDAPQGQQPPAARTGCAVVPIGASGTDALAAVAKPQFDGKGLMCAVDSFPAGTCGTEAQRGKATPTGAAAPGDKKASSSTGLVVGVGLILLVAAAGLLTVMRRRGSARP